MAGATWLIALQSFAAQAPKKEEAYDPNKPVSYYKQIRPIFQAQCQGCHQPAKAKGDYVMTEFARLLTGGENGTRHRSGQAGRQLPRQADHPGCEGEGRDAGEGRAAPRDPDRAHQELDRGRRAGRHPGQCRAGLRHGASAGLRLPPVVTSLDYSPDGKLLAVAGFHEVLLHKADGSGIEARLVGLSERIQKRALFARRHKLAVAGGSPGRMGEVQVWDVEKRKLDLSVSITFDTLYGASWSPDGKQVAFGGSDNAVRAIEAATGKQTALQPVRERLGAGHRLEHEGQPRRLRGPRHDREADRGRDRSASWTTSPPSRPARCKGGMHALARHPQRDEILIGGADGVPQIYRMERVTIRAHRRQREPHPQVPRDGGPHLRASTSRPTARRIVAAPATTRRAR